MAKFTNKFTSIKQDWETPINLFQKLNSEFLFNFDLAASNSNFKCKNYFSINDNSLKQDWNGICWLNPPYGDKKSKLSDWCKKAYLESVRNDKLIVVMLIPARTNTKWFHDYCMKASELRFICGRPKFGGADHGLPQPLVIVVFQKNKPLKVSSYYI